MGCHVAPLCRLAWKGWTGKDLVLGTGLRACAAGGAPTVGQHARARTRNKAGLGKRRRAELRQRLWLVDRRLCVEGSALCCTLALLREEQSTCCTMV
eukprot:1178238-Amphidinium_carterae.1